MDSTIGRASENLIDDNQKPVAKMGFAGKIGKRLDRTYCPRPALNFTQWTGPRYC